MVVTSALSWLFCPGLTTKSIWINFFQLFFQFMAKFWPICPILLLFVDILLKEGDNFPCQVLSSIMLHFDNSSKVKLLFTKCADYQQRHSRVFAFQSFPLSNGGFVYCFRREVTMDKMFLFTKNISKAIFFESRN